MPAPPRFAAGPVRLLLVEDDAALAETLRAVFEHAGFEVEVCADGSSALARFDATVPSVVVLDGMLPGRDGFDLCRAIRARSVVPVVMLTARTTEDDVLRGLALGADDYVKKPFSPRELVARIETILRRSGSVRRLVTGSLVVDLERREARLDGVAEPLPLTATEFRLLVAFARRPGRVFTREELLVQIAGEDADVAAGPRAVDMHVVHLRRKLSGAVEPPRLETVYGVGYRLAGSSS